MLNFIFKKMYISNFIGDSHKLYLLILSEPAIVYWALMTSIYWD